MSYTYTSITQHEAGVLLDIIQSRHDLVEESPSTFGLSELIESAVKQASQSGEAIQFQTGCLEYAIEIVANETTMDNSCGYECAEEVTTLLWALEEAFELDLPIRIANLPGKD